MTARSTGRHRATDVRPLFLLLFVAIFAALILVARPTDAGAVAGGRLVAEPVLSATAAGVRQLFGASPNEIPGEVWGVGAASTEHAHIVRYTTAAGWETVPDPVDPEGHTLALSPQTMPLSATAGRTTAAGGVVTVAALTTEEKPSEDLIIRDPGGSLRAIPTPTEPIMLKSEQLFRSGNLPVVDLTAVEEPDGDTGAFVVPFAGIEVNTGILHYDGTGWSREKICVTTNPACTVPVGFKILAIEAAGPGQEWMLARRPAQHEGIVLLKREEGAWHKQNLGGPVGQIYAQQEPLLAGIEEASILAREKGQPLTVTSKGVWVDANITIEKQPFNATIYYDVGEGDPHRGEVTGTWCDPAEATPEAVGKELCEFPLPAELPTGEGRSFAWPGTGAEGDFGTRAITGVGQGAMLVFENGAFRKEPLSGNGGSTAGAALASPEEGWLGPSYRLTREPVPSGLRSWPVPFRQPLLALTSSPGAAVGPLTSQALAVGASGEVARYYPGVGWQPESLLTGSGARATPNLRAVAWPTRSFAYAVGDEGAMWLWRSSTGLWEPDPGSPPNLIRGNFTGIAFDPEEPDRGYAVGKQGLLLEYGKRWTQVPLPAGLSPEINITSIAFAGHEALATWMLQVPAKNAGDTEYVGGLIVDNGSGWHTEEAVGSALAEAEHGINGVAARRVAALPDGGAVVVGLRGAVVEREVAGAPWHTVPGPLVGYPAAVAAVREGGQLRALISVGSSPLEEESDRSQAVGQPTQGQAPLLTGPYPLPRSGSLIRQTASGWRDEEHQTFPAPAPPTDQSPFGALRFDLPREADPILAISVSPEGTEGWVVGGQTGETAPPGFGTYISEGLQTAAVERYGPAATPPKNFTATPILLPENEATFAVGGGAACEGSCADLADTGIGPEVWLRAAVSRAAAIPGLRDFLYTGGGVSRYTEKALMTPSAFGEEERAYAERLGAEGGALPVFAAPAASDIYKSSLAAFAAGFEGFPSPLGSGSAAGTTPVSAGERGAGNYSYSFDSANSSGGGIVRVIVLDESAMPLATTKLCWLGAQLAQARAEAKPALVVGNLEIGVEAELKRMLVTGSTPACPQAAPGAASAYLFETEGNSASALSFEGVSIPAYGTGTLGYMRVPRAEVDEFLPASGFLLVSVNLVGRSPTNNVAPVTARLIPSIGSLAIDARDGTLLRRSQVALFEGLARRPLAGSNCTAQSTPTECFTEAPDPYVAIPAHCIAGRGYRGRLCSAEILPEYKFTSSRPDIANFVEVDPNSTNPRAAFLNSAGKTVADPTSGLLCAFNSGTTVVSVETGGLSYSVPVTVQAGSVQRPCGTVPRADIAAEQPPVEAPPPPLEGKPSFKNGPGPIPVKPPPGTSPIPPVAPTSPPTIPVAQHVPAKPAPSPLQLPFFAPAPVLSPIVVIVPPPPPPAVEPTPPSGTSPVTQPAVSPEPEEEEEAAFDLVHHAVAYVPGDRRPAALRATSSSGGSGGHLPHAFLPALLGLAALALAAGAGPRLRRSPEPAFNRNRPQRSPFDGHP